MFKTGAKWLAYSRLECRDIGFWLAAALASGRQSGTILLELLEKLQIAMRGLDRGD